MCCFTETIDYIFAQPTSIPIIKIVPVLGQQHSNCLHGCIFSCSSKSKDLFIVLKHLSLVAPKKIKGTYTLSPKSKTNYLLSLVYIFCLWFISSVSDSYFLWVSSVSDSYLLSPILIFCLWFISSVSDSYLLCISVSG